MGLRPGGQPLAAIAVRSTTGRLWAGLYRVEAAKPARLATPAQLDATRKATAARFRCTGGCGEPTATIPPKATGFRGVCCAA